MDSFGNDDFLLEFAFSSPKKEPKDEDYELVSSTPEIDALEILIDDKSHENKETEMLAREIYKGIQNSTKTNISSPSFQQNTFENEENISQNSQKNNRKIKFQSNSSPKKTEKDFCKYNRKQASTKDAKKSSEASKNQRKHKSNMKNLHPDQKERSKSKSAPKNEKIEYEPETLNIAPMDKPEQPQSILKRIGSKKRIASGNRSRGPGSIHSNRGSSCKSQRGCNTSQLLQTHNNSIAGLQSNATGMKNLKYNSVSLSQAESENSCDSRYGSQKRAGSICRGNIIQAKNNMSFNAHQNIRDSYETNGKSLANSGIRPVHSPVLIRDEEVNFKTEESKCSNEDLNELDKLLQLNEDPPCNKEIMETQEVRLQGLKDSRATRLSREDIINLPKPVPQNRKCIIDSLKSLKEPIMINGLKIYEPVGSTLWEVLQNQPLTALRLKLSKPKMLENVLNRCEEVLSQTMGEHLEKPSPMLRALQFRLIRILYKKQLYPLTLRLQETIYEYNSKLVSLEELRMVWKQTCTYTRKVNGDKGLVSKVRQNRAFEMRRQMNVNQFGVSKTQNLHKSKYEEREQECELNYKLCKDICKKLLQKCCLLSLRLHTRINQEIRRLVDLTQGNTEVKRKIFDQFKLLRLERAERNKVYNNAQKHMQQWKLYMCLKFWQNIKQYEAKQLEREEKAVELFQKRRVYRIFHHFKLGIVQSRISIINKRLIYSYYSKKIQAKSLIEWCRRTHVDKSIKEKVIKMMNKSNTSLNSSLYSMNKIQLENYFNNLRESSDIRINEDVSEIIRERDHYKVYIKNEQFQFETDINTRYPLKLDIQTKTFFDLSFRKIKCENQYFKSSRENFALTPEKLRRRDTPQTKFVDLLKSHNRQNSFDRLYETSIQPYTEDLKKSMAEKEMIHKSLHNFRLSQSTYSQSPSRHNENQGLDMSPYGLDRVNICQIKAIPCKDDFFHSPNQEVRGASQLNSFPKPLPRRVFVPQNAPNDIFRKLESKMKASMSVKKNESFIQPDRSGLIAAGAISPEVRIKNHIRTLLNSMRALRDVPGNYFKNSFFNKSQLDTRNIKSLEDTLRQARKMHPEMPMTELCSSIYGSKIVSLCFTQWKIAFIQKWICTDMQMLQRYRAGKTALRSIRAYLQEKRSNIQEFKIKRELMFKSRVLKAWQDYRNLPIKRFRQHRILLKWKKAHSDTMMQRFKLRDALQFRTRLLQQKVMYILYRFSQSRIIPKRRHQITLKTKAMFSWIQWHKKVKSIRNLCSKYMNQESVKTAESVMAYNYLVRWRNNVHEAISHERDQVMTYTALNFRISTLCSKAFRAWKMKINMMKVINKAERKIICATLGFPFFCIKDQSERNYMNIDIDSSQSSEILQHQYESDKLKCRLAILFRKRSLMISWREVALSKRIDFPCDYYNLKTAKKAFGCFKVALKNRWIKQKNNILCEAYIERREEKIKMKVYIKLFQNVLASKRERYQEKVCDDFRKDFLITKAFKSLKTKHTPREGIDKAQFNKVQYMRPEFSQNLEEPSGSSQFQSLKTDSRELSIKDLKEVNQDNKDELLEDIYQRVMVFKRKMLKTRCFVAWKYHFRYEKSITIQSSPMGEGRDDQLELSGSSILNLSLSNDNGTHINHEDLELSEQPRSFTEEFCGENQNPKGPNEYSESHCQRFFKDLENVMRRRKIY
ncbi:unnamed protein product [Moneuplotes crassus]|uniref:Uncharacterized protein n=1 Tax=Euplotes crassus TaxID=5936 RepID=A0AAD2DBT1_EUPCR|nr:unnamed protein product [Moneuplotes crassus]